VFSLSCSRACAAFWAISSLIRSFT
jgi:hypothetical protein